MAAPAAATAVRSPATSKPRPHVVMTRGYPSLFAPDSEDELSSDSGSDGEGQTRPSLLPLDELIQETPNSLASLLEHFLPRLQPRAEVRGVSLEDQQNFATILVGELASQFSVIHRQIDDPFLTQLQNKTLHRQVVVQVCKIVEELYSQYIAKAAKLGGDGVFSLAANLSRLRAQLTLQANKSLNIPAIRRQVLNQLRSPLSTKPSRLPPLPSRQDEKGRRSQAHKTNLEELKLDEPLKTKLSRFGIRFGSGTVKRRVRKLESRIPKLASMELAGAESDEGSSIEERVDSRPATTEPQLQRVPSMPELWGDFLLCDMRLTSRHKRLQRRDPKQRLLGIKRPQSVESIMDLKLDGSDSATDRKLLQLGSYTFKDLSDDVHELSSLLPSSSTKLNSGAEDLHPLLQAHVHGLSEKRAQRLAKLRTRQPEAGEEEEGKSSSDSLLAHSIPSVPTMDQLPYLNIQHASGPSSSHPSMYVKSSASLLPPKATASSAALGSSMPSFSCESIFPEPEEFVEVEKEGNADVQQLTGSINEAAGLAPQFGSSVAPSHSHIGSSMTGSETSVVWDQSPLQMSRQSQNKEAGSGGVLLQDASRLLEEQLSTVGDSVVAPGVCRSGGLLLDSTLDLHQSQMDVSGSTNTLSAAFSSSWERPDDLGEDDMGEESKEEEEAGTELSHPQPAVITTRINNQEIVRTSDIRVSERVPLNSLRLKPFGPIYNELTGELDATMVEELDSTLNKGKEIAALYQEISKTLSTSYLQFESEPTLEPTINSPVDLSQILASGTLHHRRSRRVINHDLHPPTSPPWGKEASRKEWEKSNQYQGPDLQQFGITLGSGPLSPQAARLARIYTTWLNWWRSTIDSEDYLKFASREESDYLHLVYHLYDSDGSDSETEQEERERRERLASLHARLKAKEARWRKLQEKKSCYEAGMWNVNAVMMGGLGGDPETSSSEEGDATEDLEDKASPLATQDLLQAVWTRLHFPEAQQIDMAIKYSSQLFVTQMNQVLELWTSACNAIEKRESFLSKLETFEREASDPGRFFARGQRGSSAARLQEARTRDRLHKELDELDSQVSQIIKQLELKFGDVVTYKGRPYHEKMRSDRTEMLYWLQQERRQAVLKPALRSLNHSVVTLPPSTLS